MGERRDKHLAVLMTGSLRAAVTRAAERRYQSASEFVRQATVEALRADGIEPTTSTTLTTPSSSPVEQVA